MANVDDVVAATLEHTGSVDTWKLQKLLYYCQAWHLVWESEALFPNRIEAWANGPVVRAVYNKHRRQFTVGSWDGKSSRLTEAERDTIKRVAAFYGQRSGHELSALTHREAPWKNARRGLDDSERSEREITKSAMAEYYGGLVK